MRLSIVLPFAILQPPDFNYVRAIEPDNPHFDISAKIDPTDSSPYDIEVMLNPALLTCAWIKEVDKYNSIVNNTKMVARIKCTPETILPSTAL
jgi:hypothetical protein